MSLRQSFNEALAHLMIARGSVAFDVEPNGFGSIEGRFGSYYSSSIDGDPVATVALWERLCNGAKILYDQCGPSDFGQEARFNGTFTDTQLYVRYSTFYIVLDDEPNKPILLVAAMNELEGSFIKTLEMLSTIGSFEQAVAELEKRVDLHTAKDSFFHMGSGMYSCSCSVGRPTLYRSYYDY